MSVWGATLQSLKTTSCTFLVNQMAALNSFSSDLTKNLGINAKLPSILDVGVDPFASKPIKSKKGVGFLNF